MNKIIKKRDNEQGVALLLTLGIVSLLLMLALSFALTARTDRHAASVNADMIKARLLAGSGLERALGYLSHGHQNEIYPGTLRPGLDGFFNRGSDTDSNDPWFQHRFMVSEGGGDDTGLERALGIRFFTRNPSRAFPYTPNDDIPDHDGVEPSWHHIKNADDDLVGRVAFLVIDESGKIDPNMHLYREHDAEYYDDEHPIFDAHNNPNNFVYRYNQVTGDRFDWNPVPTTLNRWYSWFQLIGTPGLTNIQRATAISRRFFPWSRDRNQYWDPQATPPAYRSRLRLRNFTWETASVSSVRNQIPWIDELESTDGTSNTVIRNQVAANLIAYSSPEDAQPPNNLTIDGTAWDNWDDGDRAAWPAAGFDGWPIDPAASGPTIGYIGRKAVPYINELAIGVYLDHAARELQIDIEPELINIYDDGETSCNLTVLVRLNNIPDEASLASTSPRIVEANEDGVVIHWPNQTVSNNSYTAPGSQTMIFNMPEPEEDEPLEVEDLYVEAFAVVRSIDNRTAWDAADMGESDSVDLDSLANIDQYINFSAGDPRANTRSTHWARTVASSSAGSNYSIGGVNHNADLSTGDDAETVNDPAAGISTAFIRNEPMKSLWEMGAIHRGEPWQTLNLTAFNDGTEDRNWENGDAAILDQVALAGGSYRINVNTHVEQVVRSLFEGVTTGGAYDDPWSGSTINPATIPDSLINEFLFRTRGTGADDEDANPFINRGEIARIEQLIDGNTQREQEELIGKIAHLLGTRNNYFRIAVTAQAVIDLDSPPSAVRDERNVFRYDEGNDLWCRVLAEQKIMAIVYRDAFENTYNVLRYEYLED